MSGVVDAATAAVLGVALASGLMLLLSCIPMWRARALPARLAPYLRDVSDGDPRLATTVLVDDARDRRVPTDRLLQGDLLRARWVRSDVLIWTCGGVATGAAILIMVAASGGMTSPLVMVSLPILGGAAGVMCRKFIASARERARAASIEDEVPVVLEFLALCLSAGESLIDALRRVSERGRGAVAGALRTATIEVGTGESLPAALGSASARLGSPAMTRAVDHLVAAIDRGTPLVEVLHAQAQDARSRSQRTLIEQAGRKEILMMLPVVFLILPVSVLFAIFPGVVMLRLG
ncbi:hypothetical protein GCM10009808_04660 [Microbacterium sediminicola]|uniref:Type II secretion system protein GspF domain-containing protein n=1 Tax=Microbacterium sediminicola TaxID=415210 RepID=A0ABN2HNG6_9MICO